MRARERVLLILLVMGRELVGCIDEPPVVAVLCVRQRREVDDSRLLGLLSALARALRGHALALAQRRLLTVRGRTHRAAVGGHGALGDHRGAASVAARLRLGLSCLRGRQGRAQRLRLHDGSGVRIDAALSLPLASTPLGGTAAGLILRGGGGARRLLLRLIGRAGLCGRGLCSCWSSAHLEHRVGVVACFLAVPVGQRPDLGSQAGEADRVARLQRRRCLGLRLVACRSSGLLVEALLQLAYL